MGDRFHTAGRKEKRLAYLLGARRWRRARRKPGEGSAGVGRQRRSPSRRPEREGEGEGERERAGLAANGRRERRGEVNAPDGLSRPVRAQQNTGRAVALKLVIQIIYSLKSFSKTVMV